MRDHVNSEVKHRELWRPFAPSILKEAANHFLGDKVDSPFMLKAVPVPSSKTGSIGGTVHVDGTIRLQTVENSSDPLYHNLIEGCHRLLGVPAVLNTSFNDESEPIVCTPRDALRTFWSTGIDCLLIGPFLIGPKRGFVK
jgi:carbamoyltransferase